MKQEHLELAQAAARNKAHYASFVEFCCLFEGNTFDKEVERDECWQGFVRNEEGALELHAEFVYDGEKVDEKGDRMGVCWFI